jgi:penicillin-binding protein 1A
MPHVIERVSTPDGKVLYAHNRQPLGRVVEARYAGMMNRMMEDTLTIGTAHKAALPGWQAAGKTGTSQDFRDAWFIGYTSHLVTGVWLGNDDNSPTKHVTGGGMPVEIWSRFMRVAHQGVAPEGLPTGAAPGGLFSGLFGGGGQAPPSARPSPPAAVPQANVQRQSNSSASLDGFLINNLFGRRRD